MRFRVQDLTRYTSIRVLAFFMQAVEADNVVMREELAAVSGDLEALVRENQVIVAQLTGT